MGTCVCLLAQVSKPGASTVAPSAAATLAFEHAVAFVLLVIDGCNKLLTHSLEQLKRASGDVRCDPLDAREAAVQILSEGALLLLQPLLSSIMSMRMNAPTASRLLPRFLALLQLQSELMVGLSAAEAAESDFIAGRSETFQTRRTAWAESAHPANGLVESVLTIPGAKSLRLSLSSATVQGLRMGGQLFLSRKAQREDLVASFSGAYTSDSVSVPGDTVHIAYQSGPSDSFGFAITATGEVTEHMLKLPLILDSTKSTALLAGRLSLVLVRGVPAVTPPVAPPVTQVKAATKGLPPPLALHRPLALHSRRLPRLTQLQPRLPRRLKWPSSAGCIQSCCRKARSSTRPRRQRKLRPCHGCRSRMRMTTLRRTIFLCR
jgi:hypothetical protein